jgi:hypothetical protein
MPVTEKDRGILARTIWGEARDENVVGQIAIAWTIRNWLFDGKPKSWWRRICQRLPGAVPVQLLEQNRSDPTAQPKPLNVWSSAPEALGVVTRTRDIKDCAKPIDPLLGAQLINQRVCLCSSDIKSAVAFFKMDFSRSGRAIRASSSCIFCRSGVSALF